MIGYTRKVGLRKPVLECAECWITDRTCTHPELARAEVQARRRHVVAVTCDQIARVEEHCGNRTLTGDHHAVCDCPPSANLVDAIRKTSDRYDPRGQESGQVHK